MLLLYSQILYYARDKRSSLFYDEKKFYNIYQIPTIHNALEYILSTYSIIKVN